MRRLTITAGEETVEAVQFTPGPIVSCRADGRLGTAWLNHEALREHLPDAEVRWIDGPDDPDGPGDALTAPLRPDQLPQPVVAAFVYGAAGSADDVKPASETWIRNGLAPALTQARTLWLSELLTTTAEGAPEGG